MVLLINYIFRFIISWVNNSSLISRQIITEALADNNTENSISLSQFVESEYGTNNLFQLDWLVILLFFVVFIGLIFFMRKREVVKLPSQWTNTDGIERVNYWRSAQTLFIATAFLYSVLPFTMPFAFESVDPIWMRFTISGLILVAYFLIHFKVAFRQKLSLITKLLYCLMILHHFYLIYINGFGVYQLFYALALLTGSVAVFKKFKELLVFAVSVILISLLYVSLSDVNSQLNPLFFIGMIAVMLLISLVVQTSSLDLFKHLEFSNMVVNEADALVFIVDEEGKCLYTSFSIATILGYEPEEILKKKVTWLEMLVVDKKESAKVKNNLIRLAKGIIEPGTNPPQRLFSKDHQERWISFREKRIGNNRVLIIGVDITEQKSIQDELAESENNFRQINETISGVFYLYNLKDDAYEYVSNNAYKIFGIKSGWFYQNELALNEVIVDEDQPLLDKAMEVVQQGNSYEVEYRIRKKGETRWINEKLFPVFNENREVIKNSGFCEDVTEQKIAKEEIKKLSLVTSNTDNFILLVNADNRVEWANDAFYNLTGFSPKEVVNSLPLSLISGPETDEDQLDELSVSIFQKKQQIRTEIVAYKKDEETFFAHLEVTPLLNASGDLEKYFIIGLDISQRERDRLQIEKLSLVASNTTNYVLICHKHTGIEWVNEAFVKTMGYSFEEVIGKTPSRLLHSKTHPISIESLAAINQTVFAEKQKFTGEFMHRTKTGKPIFARVDIIPIIEDDGRVEKFFVLGVDISDRKKQEDKIAQIANRLDIVHSIENAILTAEGTEEIINNTLTKTIEKFPVLRVSLVLFNFSENTFVDYTKTKIKNKIAFQVKEYPLETFSTLQKLKESKEVLFYNVAEKKVKSEIDQELEKAGIKRSLMTPLYNDRDLIGSFNIGLPEEVASKDLKYLRNITKEIAAGLSIAMQESMLQEKLAASNAAITSSISYAKMIQQSYLPKNLGLNNRYFTNSFIIDRPKDIVSGDFYWKAQYGNKFVLAVGDCTGHGVPGAFMTIIGINMLNNIVMNKGITDPKNVLEELNVNIREALKSDEDSGLSDGMDVGIVTYDADNETLVFSGAKRPLYQYSKNELTAYKGARFSIGDTYPTEVESKYHNVEINYQKGDRFYLFSDGCTDQFGGPRKRKFSRLRMEELLNETSTLSIADQYKQVDTTFKDWQGTLPQIDDILFVGFEVE